MNTVELLGYLASAIVVGSLAMSSVVRLRVLSLIGSTLFGVYGLLIGAIPIVATNVVIIAINGYFLWRAFTDTEFFDLLEVRPDSKYVEGLVDFYRDDIAKTRPGFRFDPKPNQIALLVLRNMIPAALLIAEPVDDTTLRVVLDFATPRYRDFKNGRYLFWDHPEVFLTRGYRRLVAEDAGEAHRKYLQRMGFRTDGDGYVLELTGR